VNVEWECQICHKTFVEKDHFTGHVSVHHKIGQFACKKCHKEYAYKASFTRHMKVCKKADNTNIQEYLVVHIVTPQTAEAVEKFPTN
jgi:hypothetical protein